MLLENRTAEQEPLPALLTNTTPAFSAPAAFDVRQGTQNGKEWLGRILKYFPTHSAAGALTNARTKSGGAKHSYTLIPSSLNLTPETQGNPTCHAMLRSSRCCNCWFIQGSSIQYATQPLTCCMSKLVISICTMQASKFSNLFLSWKWSSKSFITWAVIPISLSLKIYGSKHSRKMPLATEFSLILSYIWLNNRSLGGRKSLVIKWFY